MPTSDYMVNFMIVLETGEIAKIARCELSLLEDQETGDGYLVAMDRTPPDPEKYFWTGSGFEEYPPRPSRDHQWNGTEWIDDRSQAEVDSVIEAELIQSRLSAVADINATAGIIRRRYVTDIPGQEALYLMKEAEARAWVASNDPDLTQFPLIYAEVGITGTDAQQVAQTYLNLAGIYVQAAAQLEAVRLGYIAQAENAPTPEAALAVAQAFSELIAQT